MKSFIKRWHKVGIQDDGAYTSEEYKTFARDLKKSLLRALKTKCSEYEIVNYRIGHYDLSGFIKLRDKYIYISHDVPRGNYPVNLYAVGASEGWLYRTAKNDTDFTGGTNNFCSTIKLVDCIDNMMQTLIAH